MVHIASSLSGKNNKPVQRQFGIIFRGYSQKLDEQIQTAISLCKTKILLSNFAM